MVLAGTAEFEELVSTTKTHIAMNNRLEVIRIFVDDDHPMVRTGLAAMIQAEPGLAFCGEAASGADALVLAPPARPDVVLMALVMPQMDGVAATEALLRVLPDARIVVLSSLVDAAQIQRALKAGAAGYVSKTASAHELVTIITTVHGGRRVMSADATDALIQAGQVRAPGGDLSTREREVLRAMAQGWSNLIIGRELDISVPTVKFHVTNILAKLGVQNRTEAVLLAMRHKLAEMT